MCQQGVRAFAGRERPRRHAAQDAGHDMRPADIMLFCDGFLASLAGSASSQALVNAAVVADAEVYYRNMLTRDELTWNLRDQHSEYRILRQTS